MSLSPITRPGRVISTRFQIQTHFFSRLPEISQRVDKTIIWFYNRNMQLIVILLAIFASLTAFSHFGQIEKPGDILKPNETVSQANLTEAVPAKIEAVQAKTNGTVSSPETKEPTVLIDTLITSGPENGEILNEKNQATFEFKWVVSSTNIPGGMYFETKAEGLDNDWQITYSNQRTIDFPADTKEHTFLVRARSKDFVDETPAKRTFKFKMSPYFDKVKISSVSPSLIVLSSRIESEEKINITNWQISGRKGAIAIPQSVELYIVGSPLVKNDIFIGKSDTVRISDGQSPFGLINRSFRPNKCFGYLANYYGSDFPFTYGKVCPKIDCEQITYLSGTCQNYVKRLQNCNVLDYSKEPVSFDSNCVDFINNYIAENLNYNGCVENYYKDKDFSQNTWYIYPGYSIFCECTDALYLYDGNGFLVDKYFYKS